MTNLENATADDLFHTFNSVREAVGKKPVKKGSYNRQQMLTFINKNSKEVEKPVAGKFTYCPHCKIHLDNGWAMNGDEVNGVPLVFKHEFVCLGCNGEFGEEIAQPETFTMGDICEALGINPKVARSRYRNFDNDGVTTRYEFPRGRWDEIAMIISPKRK